MKQHGDGEWQVGAVARQRELRAGADMEYPGRVAVCPRGHARVLPSRFSRKEFDLRCHECGRSYLFREPTE